VAVDRMGGGWPGCLVTTGEGGLQPPQASRRCRASFRQNPRMMGACGRGEAYGGTTFDGGSTRRASARQRAARVLRCAPALAGDQRCPAVYGPLRKWSRDTRAPDRILRMLAEIRCCCSGLCDAGSLCTLREQVLSCECGLRPIHARLQHVLVDIWNSVIAACASDVHMGWFLPEPRAGGALRNVLVRRSRYEPVSLLRVPLRPSLGRRMLLLQLSLSGS
jgi:hypothetical protein